MYVTEYVLNTYMERERNRLYQVYITDAIKYAFNLPLRYYDVAYTGLQEEEEDEEETAEEIKNRIMDGLNRLGSNTEE